MSCKTRLLSELGGILRSLEDSRIELLVFRKADGELQMRVSENTASLCSPERGSSQKEGPLKNPGPREGILPHVSRSGIRLVILRSPGVGRWSADLEGGNNARTLEKGARVGRVHSLLDDEPLFAPCRGRIEKWLVAEGEAVGFDTPLALWEVV